MRKNDQVETKRKISVLQSTRCTAHDLQGKHCMRSARPTGKAAHTRDWSDCMSLVSASCTHLVNFGVHAPDK